MVLNHDVRWDANRLHTIRQVGQGDNKMKIKIEDAESLQEYIKWYIGKAFNVPMLKSRLEDALRMMEKYSKKELTVVVKL